MRITLQRTLEMVFRHLGKLFLLVVIPPIVGFGIAYTLPRSYQSVAGVQAINRYALINTAGAIESNTQATLAQTQVDALNDDLQSPAFDLAVAQATDLPRQVQASIGTSDPHVVYPAISQDLSTHVVVVAEAYNRYTITYTNANQRVAQQVVAAVIGQFAIDGPAAAVLGGQKVLAAYNDLLTAATNRLTAAISAQNSYTAAHPNLIGNALLADPRYAVLAGAVLHAQTDVSTLQNTISAISEEIGQLSSSDTLFQITDSPSYPYRAVSRVRTFLIGAGGGLAVGLLMCALYVTLLLRRNRAIYSAQDVLNLPGLPPVLMLVPAMSSSAAKTSVRLLGASETSPVSDGKRNQKPARR